MSDDVRTVAILADVHGNLPALEAVLADVDARGIGEIVVAGDLVGFGAGPNAVVDRLVGSGATLIRGNHEADYVGGYADPATRAAWRADPGLAGMCWYLDRLGSRRAALLTALPDRHWLDPATLVTHGSPRHIRDSVLTETPAEDLAAMFDAEFPRLTFVGHTHLPVIRAVPWGRVVNVGSVGAPRGGRGGRRLDGRAPSRRLRCRGGDRGLRRGDGRGRPDLRRTAGVPPPHRAADLPGLGPRAGRPPARRLACGTGTDPDGRIVIAGADTGWCGAEGEGT